LFKQQRYYLGSTGWQEYDLPTTHLRQLMQAEYGGGQGGAAGGPTKGGGRFPTMGYNDIATMGVPAMKKWLAMADEYHNTNGVPNDNMEQRLTGLMDLSARAQRLRDGNAVAMRDGIPSNNYGREAQFRSNAARERNKLTPPSLDGTNPDYAYGPDLSNLGWRNYWDAQARRGSVNRLSDYMEEQVKRMNDDEAQIPGKKVALEKPIGSSGPSATVVGPWGTALKIDGGTSDSSSVSPHRDINATFESGDQKDIDAGLRSKQAEFDRQFEESYSDAVTHNYRLTPAVVAYHNAIQHRGDVEDGYTVKDEGNAFRDKSGRLVNPYKRSTASPTPTPTPTPTPSPSPGQRGRLSITSEAPVTAITGDNDPKLKNLSSGDLYRGPDGVLRAWP
jgi:hypothetical protein